MKYSVEIFDNLTGEKRVCADVAGGWDEYSEFLWTEGNNSCDCNRGLHFARANGEDDPDRECGEERYSVPRAILEDGTIVPLDDAPETEHA